MNTFGLLHFSHSQDLLGVRVSRCLFDTGAVDALTAARRLGGGTPTAVLYRAGQAMAAAFEHCTFTGPAAPMFHSVTLRMSIVGCSFDTRAVGPGELDGVDLFLDTPAFEGKMPARSFPSDPTSLTVKDVVSRSPRFITSFRTPVTNVAIHTAITLIGVDHRPTLANNEPLPPAILWAGPARSGGRLVLMGCRFDRLARPPVPGDVLEPVAVDLATGNPDAATLDTLVRGINNPARSDGHVVNLGTAVVRPDRTISLVTLEPTVRAVRAGAFPPGQENRVVDALILERYSTG